MKTIAKIFIAILVAFVLINIFKVMLPLIASFMIAIVVIAGFYYICITMKKHLK